MMPTEDKSSKKLKSLNYQRLLFAGRQVGLSTKDSLSLMPRKSG